MLMLSAWLIPRRQIIAIWTSDTSADGHMDSETLEQQDKGLEMDPNPPKWVRIAGDGEATENRGGGRQEEEGSVDVVGEYFTQHKS